MAQPVTALLNPEPDDNRPMPPCPPFCDGTCSRTPWAEQPGDAHHTSGYTIISFASDHRGSPVEWDVSVSRIDTDYTAGPIDVNVIPYRDGGGASMTAAEARRLAAHLMNCADVADPLPAGAMATTAANVRIGDELLTDDGWQKVTGLLFCSDIEQASIFTLERGGDMDGTDGWDLSFHDPVKVRRPLHGSCAIQFVEPTP